MDALTCEIMNLFPIGIAKEQERAKQDGRDETRIRGLFLKRTKDAPGIAFSDLVIAACERTKMAATIEEALALGEQAHAWRTSRIFCKGKHGMFPMTIVFPGEKPASDASDSLTRLGLAEKKQTETVKAHKPAKRARR